MNLLIRNVVTCGGPWTKYIVGASNKHSGQFSLWIVIVLVSHPNITMMVDITNLIVFDKGFIVDSNVITAIDL